LKRPASTTRGPVDGIRRAAGAPDDLSWSGRPSSRLRTVLRWAPSKSCQSDQDSPPQSAVWGVTLRDNAARGSSCRARRVDPRRVAEGQVDR
jgi:hypothetical protein